MLVRDLKSVAVDVVDLEEAIVTLALTELASNQFRALAIPVPEWLQDKRDALKREVEAKSRDYLAAKLKMAKLKRQNLKTREERAKEADAEIAALEQQLGVPVSAITPNSGAPAN